MTAEAAAAADSKLQRHACGEVNLACRQKILDAIDVVVCQTCRACCWDNSEGPLSLKAFSKASSSWQKRTAAACVRLASAPTGLHSWQACTLVDQLHRHMMLVARTHETYESQCEPGVQTLQCSVAKQGGVEGCRGSWLRLQI